MPIERRCEKCGAVLAAFGPAALCPNCMLREAVRWGADLTAEPAATGPGKGAAVVTTPMTEKVGDRIGRYKLLQPIGEGGMGVVYMAEQEEPVRRRVALKVIKLGMDTRSVIARFEAERQALALMDHPNIAKVLDAGATDTGRPYFVMELVRGIRITDYCDQNQLATRQRLDLFTQICKAIQHAHQKGVIHRDIKPSNILVTLHDGVPVPKIIDFGIAKATSGERLTDKTLFTAFEQFVGTPAYMSPEQAELSGLDIDTRSDIYSLGVLLYELLTGQTPFEAKELLAAGLDAMRRTIREKEPPKPSTRLSAMGIADTADVTNRFKLSPAKLAALVRGDLDWIVMKALEKDRARRYESANGLAMDIQRHLNNEPVVARPPSRLYKFQKSVRRHKLGFAATGAVVLALLVGFSASTWSLIKERRARQRAMTAEAKAKTEAAKSDQVAGFLADMLEGAGPEVAKGRDATILREILDKTAERVGKELTDQPEVEANLRDTLGGTYFQLGEFAKAEAMHRQVLRLSKTVFGEVSVPVISSHRSLGSDLLDQDKVAEAETEYRASLTVLEKMPNGDQWQKANLLEALAVALARQGKPGAETFSHEAFELRKKLAGKDVGALGISTQNRAVVFANEGKLAEAETMLKEAVPMVRQVFGDKDLSLANGLSSLARVLSMEGKLAEAEPMARESLTIKKTLLGNEHQSVQISLLTLSSVLTQERKLGEAIALYRDAWEVSRKTNGAGMVSYGLRLAQLLDESGQRAEAEPLARETVELARKLEGDGSAHFAHALGSLVRILLRERKLDEYDQTVREILTPALQSQPQNADLLALRAYYFGQARRWKEAEADAAKIIELFPANFEAYHGMAAALVASDDVAGYRSLCQRMLAQFGHTTESSAALATVRDCLILPNSGADRLIVSNLVQVVARMPTNHSQFWWSQFCQGLARYREGQFASAADYMRQTMAGESKPERDFQACMILAMAHYRLNQLAEAGVAFAKGRDIEHARFPDFEQSGYRDADNWVDWLHGHALMKEAGALIEVSAKSGSEAK